MSTSLVSATIIDEVTIHLAFSADFAQNSVLFEPSNYVFDTRFGTDVPIYTKEIIVTASNEVDLILKDVMLTGGQYRITIFNVTGLLDQVPIEEAGVVLVSGRPLADRASGPIAVDPINKKMYWINVVSLADVTDLITTGLVNAHGIDLDLTINQHMYTSDFDLDVIDRYNLDGTNKLNILSTSDGLDGPRAVKVDPAGGKLYWAQTASAQGVYRANLNGTSIELLSVLTTPNDLALDLTNGRVYIAEVTTNSIRRTDLDGADDTTVFTPASGNIRSLDIDEPNSHIYYSIDSSIRRVGFNGLGDTVIIATTPVSDPEEVELDLLAGKIYWSTDSGRIYRSDLNGSNIEILHMQINGGGILHIALDVPNQELYWSDRGVDKVRKQSFNAVTGGSDVGVNAGRVLMWSDLDGLNAAQLNTHLGPSPTAVGVNPNVALYVMDNVLKTVEKSNLNGSSPVAIISLSTPSGPQGQWVDNPLGIYADPAGKIYYLDLWSFTGKTRLVRANLDGTSPIALNSDINGGDASIRGFAIDAPNLTGRITGFINGLQSINLSTGAVASLDPSLLHAGFMVWDLVTNKLFITSGTNADIESFNPDGTELVVTTSSPSPDGIGFDPFNSPIWGDAVLDTIQRAGAGGNSLLFVGIGDPQKCFTLRSRVPTWWNTRFGTRFHALLCAVGVELDNLAGTDSLSVFNEVINSILIRTATGRDLDIIGENFGVLRPFELTAADDLYRKVLPSLIGDAKAIRQCFEVVMTIIFGPIGWTIFDINNNEIVIEIDSNLFQQLFPSTLAAATYLHIDESEPSSAAFPGDFFVPDALSLGPDLGGDGVLDAIFLFSPPAISSIFDQLKAAGIVLKLVEI